MINIGGITTTIPFTGVPLPFISYGGTSLIVVLSLVGVLINVSRQTNEGALPDERPARPKPTRASPPATAGRARPPARRVPRA